MSDHSQGPGWWQASDDRWYPPDQVPGPEPTPASDPTTAYGPTAAGGTPPWGPPISPGYPSAGYGGPGYAPVGGFATAGPGAYLPNVQGLATAALVLGIVALVLFWCWFLAVLAALVGLVLGLVALSRINGGTAAPDGRGMALAGVICSGIALVLSIGLIVAVATF